MRAAAVAGEGASVPRESLHLPQRSASRNSQQQCGCSHRPC
uniref:Uncharacterized protein n=1 Tax=Arundo donax TaxID=35708 RepID=A0A0A8Y2A5_ARUDO